MFRQNRKYPIIKKLLPNQTTPSCYPQNIYLDDDALFHTGINNVIFFGNYDMNDINLDVWLYETEKTTLNLNIMRNRSARISHEMRSVLTRG
jgi:hypothetical protein